MGVLKQIKVARPESFPRHGRCLTCQVWKLQGGMDGWGFHHARHHAHRHALATWVKKISKLKTLRYDDHE